MVFFSLQHVLLTIFTLVITIVHIKWNATYSGTIGRFS